MTRCSSTVHQCDHQGGHVGGRSSIQIGGLIKNPILTYIIVYACNIRQYTSKGSFLEATAARPPRRRHCRNARRHCCILFGLTRFVINEMLLFGFRTKHPYVMSETADIRTARYPWELRPGVFRQIRCLGFPHRQLEMTFVLLVLQVDLLVDPTESPSRSHRI